MPDQIITHTHTELFEEFNVFVEEHEQQPEIIVHHLEEDSFCASYHLIRIAAVNIGRKTAT